MAKYSLSPSLTLLQKGEKLAQEGQADKAIDCCTQVIAQDPDNGAAYRQLGDIYFDLKQFETASEHYGKTIELKPKFPYPYFRLGQIYKHQEKWADSVDSFQKAITLKPNNPWFHKALGEVYLTQERFNEAEAAFQTTIELKPDIQDAYFRLGVAQQKQKKLETAIASFESFLELNSNHFGANQYLGDIYAQKKKFDTAIAHYQKAIEIKSNNPFLHVKLARAFRSEGQVEQAIGAWSAAIQLKPDRHGFHEQLGDLLLQQDDMAGAIASYEKAIALNPDLPTLKEKLNTAWQRQTINAQNLPEQSQEQLQEQPLAEAESDTLPSPKERNREMSELGVLSASSRATAGNSLDLQETPITVDLHETVKHGKGEGKSGKVPFSTHKQRGSKSVTLDNTGFQKDFSFSAEGVGGYDKNIPSPVKKTLMFFLLGVYGAIALALLLTGLPTLGIFLIVIAALILIVFWLFRKQL